MCAAWSFPVPAVSQAVRQQRAAGLMVHLSGATVDLLASGWPCRWRFAMYRSLAEVPMRLAILQRA